MIIGIDLGTTNSVAACYINGKTEIIPNRLGRLLTPSVVSIDENGEVLVGETAREFGYLHPDASARVFKRTMGTDLTYTLAGMTFKSEELSGFVLRSLKEDAEVYLGETIEEAVISVPAYFNDNQRKATKKAGELAGLKVSRIISEPTASAVAYGVGDKNRTERCMVLDLGGGTFDVSVLEYYKSIMEIHAISGDNYLGGEDFTSALIELFLKRIDVEYDTLDLITRNALYRSAEKAKCDFDKADKVTVSLTIGDCSYAEDITVSEFEAACEPLLNRIRKPIEKSLRDARISLDDIDRVMLVGGATRLGLVRSYVKDLMGIYPDFYVDPDTSVAIGAALQAAMKERRKGIEEIVLTDVCPYTLGTEVMIDNGTFEENGHFLPIIERNTVIPVSRKERVFTAHDNQKQVTIKVLQGESKMTRNNFLLGSIVVDVPEGPKGQEAIDVTYTYDVNALLEVEVTVVSTRETKRIIIQNDSSPMSEEEAARRIRLLQYLKQNPREDEENKLVLLKGERLYKTTEGMDNDLLVNTMNEFEHMLTKGSRLEIERARKKAQDLFEEIEMRNGKKRILS
ncbi:MAG: molecular chaperone HscC [Clostridiales bacterium]|nr:molecular chaperone HscC [Candidatus Crickella merdequi]